MQSLTLISSFQEHCNIDFFATQLAGQTALHWSLITQTSFSHVSHTSIYFQLHIVQTAPTSKLPNGELTRKFVQNNKLCSEWIKLIDAFLIISMGYSDPFLLHEPFHQAGFPLSACAVYVSVRISRYSILVQLQHKQWWKVPKVIKRSCSLCRWGSMVNCLM